MIPIQITEYGSVTWKYDDMKVLSTTMKTSLEAARAILHTASMSTSFMVGFVGVSIHTICQ